MWAKAEKVGADNEKNGSSKDQCGAQRKQRSRDIHPFGSDSYPPKV